jgi:hypothetical protein
MHATPNLLQHLARSNHPLKPPENFHTQDLTIQQHTNTTYEELVLSLLNLTLYSEGGQQRQGTVRLVLGRPR